MLKVNEKMHGFCVKSREEIKDISAVLYELVYEKNGARLVYLDREDNNKTFSIAFKTIPEDSSGVFHIIEHSVLCGSDKYPVKEPFVELLKSSLNTFLNAMTFPDKTMYPVSSRNNKDFLNLMDVYLDAVFHPAMLKDENVFRQEGWHYELSESGELSTSGVVLNEMRGAYSSVEDVELEYMKRMLYPDTCYRHDSGGAPDDITSLTYEEFVRLHKKYYHPSNSYIFLDGSVELDPALSLIDSYLSEYDAEECEFDIPDQPPVCPDVLYEEYEISSGESEENKTRLSLGFGGWRFDEQMKAFAINILLDTLVSSNESPIKKAMLDSGLCEDLEPFFCDSVKENIVCLGFRNVKDGKWEELAALFFDTVQSIAEKGIDRDLLISSLNSYEFKVRERDFGTMPRGIIYAMSVLESYLYGDSPAFSLSFEDTFKEIREKLSTKYFEDLLSSVFLNNKHRATLVMTPSATLGDRRAKKEAEKMQKTAEKLGDAGLEKVGASDRELKRWQEREDSEEALKTIPTLTRDDISDKVEKIPREVGTHEGVTLISHNIATDGIVYAELYFDISDFSEEEIFDFRIITALTANLPTEKRNTIELQNLIKRELGSFDLRLQSLTRDGETKIYGVLSSSALASKKEFISDIAKEVLLTTVYEDKETIRNIVRQLKLSSEDSFSSAGHQAAMGRAAAYLISDAAVAEYSSGYEAHVRLKRLDKDFDAEFAALEERLKRLAKRTFTRGRLTVSTTGCDTLDFAKELSYTCPDSERVTPVCKIKPLGIKKEGIATPSQVAYAASAIDLNALAEKITGSFAVARSILSYDYLWNTVRVQGGAYGAGMSVKKNGAVEFYSYRDPSPKRTFECYFGAGNFLRGFAGSGADLTRFIIGAVGDSEPLTSPRLRGMLSTTRYLRGDTYEDECAARKELINTDEKELCRIADILDNMESTGAFCIVGGRDKLDCAKEYLDVILDI